MEQSSGIVGTELWNCSPAECTRLILLFLGGLISSFTCFLVTYSYTAFVLDYSVARLGLVGYFFFLFFSPWAISKLIVASVHGDISKLMTV